MKCFTIFSHLKEKHRDLKIDLTNINIEHSSSLHWYPLNLIDHFYFEIHSPNTLPDFYETNLVTYDIKKEHKFYYNQFPVELLSNTYDTHCFEYDLDYKFGNFNTRSDCITTCSQKYIKSECKIKEGIVGSRYILRREVLEQDQFRELSFTKDEYICQDQVEDEAKSMCEKECKPDCIFKYYSVLNETLDNNNWDGHYLIKIIIEHNSNPDVYIKYVPQTTLLSLICNFGGLLGMWLGLSFLHTITELLTFFQRFCTKHGISINIFKGTIFSQNNQIIMNFERTNAFNRRRYFDAFSNGHYYGARYY